MLPEVHHLLGYGTRAAPQGRGDVPDAHDDETAGGEEIAEKGRRRLPEEKARKLDPLAVDAPAEDKKLMLEIRRKSKTIVAWVVGHAKQKKLESITATAQNLLREWWSRGG